MFMIIQKSFDADSLSQNFINKFPSSKVKLIDWPAKVCNNNPNNVDDRGDRSIKYATESSNNNYYNCAIIGDNKIKIISIMPWVGANKEQKLAFYQLLIIKKNRLMIPVFPWISVTEEQRLVCYGLMIVKTKIFVIPVVPWVGASKKNN